MALTREQRKYVVRSVLRILRDVNRDEILTALKEDVLMTATDAEDDGEEEELEPDMVVLAVAEACRERLRLRQQRKATESSSEEPSGDSSTET